MSSTVIRRISLEDWVTAPTPAPVVVTQEEEEETVPVAVAVVVSDTIQPTVSTSTTLTTTPKTTKSKDSAKKSQKNTLLADDLARLRTLVSEMKLAKRDDIVAAFAIQSENAFTKKAVHDALSLVAFRSGKAPWTLLSPDVAAKFVPSSSSSSSIPTVSTASTASAVVVDDEIPAATDAAADAAADADVDGDAVDDAVVADVSPDDNVVDVDEAIVDVDDDAIVDDAAAAGDGDEPVPEPSAASGVDGDDEGNDDDDEFVTKKKKRKTASKRESKAGLSEAAKAEKERLILEAKAAKEAQRAAEREAKLQKREQEKREAEAKKAAEKREADAKKAAEKAAKDAMILAAKEAAAAAKEAAKEAAKAAKEAVMKEKAAETEAEKKIREEKAAQRAAEKAAKEAKQAAEEEAKKKMQSVMMRFAASAPRPSVPRSGGVAAASAAAANDAAAAAVALQPDDGPRFRPAQYSAATTFAARTCDADVAKRVEETLQRLADESDAASVPVSNLLREFVAQCGRAAPRFGNFVSRTFHDTSPGHVLKLFRYSEDNRPPYRGTWSRTSARVSRRRPFARDDELDYDYDSDAEWVNDDEEGEDLSDIDDIDGEDAGPNDYDKGEFVVDDGYLSADEGLGDDGQRIGEDDVAGARVKPRAPEKHAQRLTPVTIGPACAPSNTDLSWRQLQRYRIVPHSVSAVRPLVAEADSAEPLEPLVPAAGAAESSTARPKVAKAATKSGGSPASSASSATAAPKNPVAPRRTAVPDELMPAVLGHINGSSLNMEQLVDLLRTHFPDQTRIALERVVKENCVKERRNDVKAYFVKTDVCLQFGVQEIVNTMPPPPPGAPKPVKKRKSDASATASTATTGTTPQRKKKLIVAMLSPESGTNVTSSVATTETAKIDVDDF